MTDQVKTDTSPKTHYKTLGVPHDASGEAIRAAYRGLAKTYHPDLNPGDKVAEGMMKGVTEAHAVLSDPETRQAYDRELARAKQRQSAEGGSGSAGRPRPSANDRGPGASVGNIFNAFFGKGTPPAGMSEKGWRSYQETEARVRDDQRRKKTPKKPAIDLEKLHARGITMPDSELGLVLALVKAHRSEEPGVWEVSASNRELGKTEGDPKASDGNSLFRVTREDDGTISIGRRMGDMSLFPDSDRDITKFTSSEMTEVPRDSFIPIDEDLGDYLGLDVPRGYVDYMDSLCRFGEKLADDKLDPSLVEGITSFNESRRDVASEAKRKDFPTLHEGKRVALPVDLRPSNITKTLKGAAALVREVGPLSTKEGAPTPPPGFVPGAGPEGV